MPDAATSYPTIARRAAGLLHSVAGAEVVTALAELDRLRTALQAIVDESDRLHHEYRPECYPTEDAASWHAGYTCATAHWSLIATAALDPIEWEAHQEQWHAAALDSDREWFARTGCCGHCGNVARSCACTPADPCGCGPHEVDPWPRECRVMSRVRQDRAAQGGAVTPTCDYRIERTKNPHGRGASPPRTDERSATGVDPCEGVGQSAVASGSNAPGATSAQGGDSSACHPNADDAWVEKVLDMFDDRARS